MNEFLSSLNNFYPGLILGFAAGAAAVAIPVSIALRIQFTRQITERAERIVSIAESTAELDLRRVQIKRAEATLASLNAAADRKLAAR